MNAKKDFQFKEVNEDRGYVRFSHSQKNIYIYVVFFFQKIKNRGILCVFVDLVSLVHSALFGVVSTLAISIQYVVYGHLAFNAIPTQVMLKYFSWHITYHAIAIIPTPIVLHFEEMKEQQCTVCDFEFFLTNFIVQYNL